MSLLFLISVQTMEGAFYLYEKGVGEEVNYGYLQLAQNLEEFVGKTFNDWVVTVDKELGRHLETQLMRTCHNRYMCLEILELGLLLL